MGDWQELIQSVIIGLIFSFMVAKLISMVISFRDDKLRVSRKDNFPNESFESKPKPSFLDESQKNLLDLKTIRDEKIEEDVVKTEKKSLLSDDDDNNDDDDWEGVEYTELDETFSAATSFVAVTASDRLSQKISSDVQLQLYGFYKIATEGPCNIPQPSALNMSARAKWNAWKRLGAMSAEEAMQMYITIVNELYPSWASGSTDKRKGGDSDATSSASKGMMGQVFSTFVYEEDSNNEAKLESIHECAREGEVDNLRKYIGSGISVNIKDSEGRTPLHWAVDRGHLNIVELLLSENADVNAKDNEGQTPLHYAAVCDRKDIAEFLVKQNADPDVKDNDGNSPCNLCESSWPWMNSSLVN